MSDKQYYCRPTPDDNWEVFAVLEDGNEEWVGFITTETAAQAFVSVLENPAAAQSIHWENQLYKGLRALMDDLADSGDDRHPETGESYASCHWAEKVLYAYEAEDRRELETYLTLALSTAHLSKEDIQLLQEASDDSDEWMVMEREPGFFIKLYEELENNLRHGHSDTIKQIIRYAFDRGFRMIEFDRDALEVDLFPTHDHH